MVKEETKQTTTGSLSADEGVAHISGYGADPAHGMDNFFVGLDIPSTGLWLGVGVAKKTEKENRRGKKERKKERKKRHQANP